MRRNSGAKRA